MKEVFDIQPVRSPEVDTAMREHALYLFGLGPVPKGLEQRAREVRHEMRRERRAKRWAAVRKFIGLS